MVAYSDILEVDDDELGVSQMLVNDAEDADDEIELQGVDVPVRHLAIEVVDDDEALVMLAVEIDVSEYLSLDTHPIADITLLEELNTYVTDTVSIALLLTELSQ